MPDRARLPNLLVIGAMKAATTSLWHYLAAHPEIHMSPVKELRFFVVEQNWYRGVDWYASHFAADDAPVRGEASPQYAMHPTYAGVPERMAALVPEARLVYIVRDPLDRLVAEYAHRRATGERRSLDACVAEPAASRYVQTSRYAAQLVRFDPWFPPERILVVDQHELLVHRAATMREVLAFAGVDPTYTAPVYAEEHNRRFGVGRQTAAGRWAWRRLERCVGHDRAHWLKGGAVRAWETANRRPPPAPRLSPARRAELAAIFADDVAALRARTGKAFGSWSV